MGKPVEEFKNKYFSLSMAIRSMACQMIGIQSSVWGSEDTYNRYDGYIKELRKRRDCLVNDWLDEYPRSTAVFQIDKEYRELEQLSIRHTKEVYEEAKAYE